jgi:hypothetical protein
VVEDAGDVGGEEVFAVAEPMTAGGPKRAATSLSGSLAERTPMAKAPVRRLTARRTASSSGMGECGEDCRSRRRARQSRAFRVFLDSAARLISLDEVGDDFGVGFGDEDVALGDELGLEGEVVFDDAVVDDDERAGAVAVGVGVLFGGAAVGGPAGVADAVGAVEGIAARTASRLRACRGRGGASGFCGWGRRRRRCRRSRSRGTRGGAGLQ